MLSHGYLPPRQRERRESELIVDGLRRSANPRVPQAGSLVFASRARLGITVPQPSLGRIQPGTELVPVADPITAPGHQRRVMRNWWFNEIGVLVHLGCGRVGRYEVYDGQHYAACCTCGTRKRVAAPSTPYWHAMYGRTS